MKKNMPKRWIAFLLTCCILAAELLVGTVDLQAAETTDAQLVYLLQQDSGSADSSESTDTVDSGSADSSESTDTADSESVDITASSDSSDEDTMDLTESMIITYDAGSSSRSAYSESQKVAYVEALLQKAWDGFTETCTFSRQYCITQSVLQTAINNLLYENYQYFYISSTCSLSYYTNTSYINTVTFSYTMTASEAAEGLEELEEAIENYADTVDSDWSEMETALYLNDLLARICEYDTSYEYFSAYDVLVRGTAVCQGYALAYQILAEELGLSCELVSSTSLDHIWNLVQINGSWYHVDVTWDDPTSDLLGKAAHNYFMKSSSYFASSGGGHAASDWSFTGDVSSSDASDTTYDSYFWNSITTGFEYVNGLWYAISGTSLNSYTCNGTSFTKKATILTVSDTWYKWGETEGYSSSYASLASWNGVLYYSTSTKIYSYNPSTSATSTAYTLSSPYTTFGYIYGIRVTLDGELQFYLASSPYSGGKAGTYTAKQLNSSVKNLINATITLSSTSYTCSGSANTPTVTVKYGSTTLTKGTDYTVSYSDNTNIGTALVTISGAGSYVGTVLKTFTITLGKTTTQSLSNTTSGIKVTWGKVAGASGYYIYRRASNGSYSLIKTITSGSTVSYTDTAVKSKSGTTYLYYVIAYYKDSSGTITKGSYVNTKTILRLSSVTLSSLTNTASGVTVKWGKITGANGYYIYRRTIGGSYSLIKTITSGSTVSYTDTAVKSKNGTTYLYYVIPYYKNSSGTITKGSFVNTKTIARLTGISISSLTNSSSKKMTVKWSKNSSATGYQIQYSTLSSFSSTTTVTVSGASTVSKVIGSLTKGKTYYVRVRVYRTVNGTKYYSAWSSAKSVKISK